MCDLRSRNLETEHDSRSRGNRGGTVHAFAIRGAASIKPGLARRTQQIIIQLLGWIPTASRPPDRPVRREIIDTDQKKRRQVPTGWVARNGWNFQTVGYAIETNGWSETAWRRARSCPLIQLRGVVTLA